MAAIGPDFKAGYVDDLPVGNADVGATAARLLGLTPRPRGHLVGRVITEAMPHGTIPRAFSGTVKSKPAANGLRTVLNFQRLQSQRYFDEAGFPGRTLGLDAQTTSRKQRGNSPVVQAATRKNRVREVQLLLKRQIGQGPTILASSSRCCAGRRPQSWKAFQSRRRRACFFGADISPASTSGAPPPPPPPPHAHPTVRSRTASVFARPPSFLRARSQERAPQPHSARQRIIDEPIDCRKKLHSQRGFESVDELRGLLERGTKRFDIRRRKRLKPYPSLSHRNG